jgi:hypothetical protein
MNEHGNEYYLAIMRLEGYDRLTIPKWSILIVLLAVLSSLTLWRAAILFHRWWNRPVVSPKRLFRALCDQHGLSHAERSLLQQIAAEGTFDPNFLFIDPELWDREPSLPEMAQQRRALFEKLFGETSVTG